MTQEDDDELLASVEAEEEEEPIQEDDLEVEDEPEEEPEPGPKPEPESTPEPEPETKEQYSARVRKRMDQLLKDRKEAREAKEAIEREREAMRAELETLRKEHYDARRVAIQAEMRKAYEEDDEEARWRLNEELIDLRLKRGDSRPQASEPEQRQAQPASEPPAARWVQRNQGWFERDPNRLEAAKRIEKELQAEGYTTDEDDLYAELDKRLDEEGISTVAAAQTTSRRTDNVTGANATRREAAPSPGDRSRVRLDREDRRHMIEMGLDWDNMEHRKEWLKSKRELAAERR